jgi:16S rRNA (uracil1498-N3)-methyltransferase
VLRLPQGETVELFDDRGSTAAGLLVFEGARGARVRVGEITSPRATHGWIVASAVPKGERADWMVEKLSELGTRSFIPLIAARSVVVPEGKNKLERWARIATESAKQSRREGVMRIETPTPLMDALQPVRDGATGICLSTANGATPVFSAVQHIRPDRDLVLFIGPEGGWTDAELSELDRAGAIKVQLTSTVLRVETAAVAASAIVGAVLNALHAT